MRDIEQAKRLLEGDKSLTCVLCRGDVLYRSQKSGIAPMMEFLDAGYDLRGFYAADRIVGKAAALLFVLAGVTELYAEVLSESALRVLNEHEITVSYTTLVPFIVNRQGDGACPMENAVREIEDPAAAREAVRQTLAKLRAKQ